ncbi:hypothetical protein N7478_008734 [Penicillium angulare]|uniref:uncharacterized protein n=1 Tax=Penicillium angulare TaxID=116970 RepID=UPI0025400A9C|nr:uncharacterized protein N7478_008734 [Penicillium angulare]KAJ5273609.1 hypothetical protein N7478_008734 [Penicillium angulare]
MFHTFELCRSNCPPEPSEEDGKPQNTAFLFDRRACEECCRRKSRCDRLQPYGSCVYYKKPHLCRYREKKTVLAVRIIHPSLGFPYHRKLSVVGLQYRDVPKRLFLSVQLESLVHFTREQLMNILLFDQRDGSNTISSLSSDTASTLHASMELESDTYGEECCLETLETVPVQLEPDREVQQDLTHGVSDDVNSLSPVAQSSCYLGVSLINAVIKVMILIDPSAISYQASLPSAKSQSGLESQLLLGTDYRDYDRENHRPLASTLNAPSTRIVQEVAPLTFHAGLKLIDAFFTNI